MPELFNSTIDVLVLKNQIIELKKKLSVEKQMYEAGKLIQVRMAKQTSVQQVENSLNESLDRMNFLGEQIKEIENQILESQLKRNESVSTEYLDALETLNVSPSNSTMAKKYSDSPFKQAAHLNWSLVGQKLTWPKIDFKINELSYRLKLNENILEAEEKIIEACKGQQFNPELIESREVTRQRVQILGQALKKYTSLIISSGGNNQNPCSATNLFDDSFGQDSQFTGKLFIKVTKIGGLTGSCAPPFNLNFDLDQLSNFRSGKSSKKSTATCSIAGSKDPENPSAYTCYQEIMVNLVRASEMELTITSGSGSGSSKSIKGSIKGIFFIKLATLFTSGPDETGVISNTFEVEPAGSINLQFHYTPDKLKKTQINKERIARIERRPAIKRTKHSVKGHELISTNFFQLLKCSYCQEMILNTSGYQCKLCKLICHKKCYSKIFETCLYSDDKKVKERSQEDEDEDEEAQNPLIDQFTSKYKIPHRQKLVSVGIPSWCAHCGHILPLGRKINYKCEECSLVWHDRCDPYICKHHCGLNSNIIESYCSTLQIVQRKQLNKSTCNIKTSVKQAVLPIPPQLATLAPMKNLKIEDFDLIKCIGKGNFGKVMLAKYKSDGSSRHFAIKILKKHSIVENEEFESLKTEKRIFQMATNEGNPFLVHMEAAFQDDYRVYFVMEFINGGDLMYHIQNRMFTLNDCKFYAAQVLIALEFMHSKGILYRDLKLDNILLTKDGNIKLADYGLSKCDMTIESRTKTFCGTPEFMAPEILLDLPYGFAVDFWAFGVLLYQLLESKSPFYGKNEKETFQSILKGKLTFSYDIDKQGKSLISKLLVSKPSDRIGIKNGEGWKAVKEQAFFSEIDWTALKQLQLPVPFVPKTKNPEDVSNFDEMFTSEEVSLTPYPSFVFSKGGLNVSKAAALFSEF